MGSARVVVLVLLALGLAAAPAAGKPSAPRKAPVATPAAPRGVLLAPELVKRVGPLTCGRIGGRWHPGALSKAGRFLTHSSRARSGRQAARKLTGAKRRKKLKDAERFAVRATAELDLCRAGLPTGAIGAPGAPGGSPYPPGCCSYTFPPYPQVPGAPLRFDLRGAVGVATRAVTGSPGQTGSNLSVIDGAGRLQDAVVSGSASVREFLTAPNGRLYVLFTWATSLDGGQDGGGCLLAEIDPGTGVPTCVDSSLNSVLWQAHYPGNANLNAGVQFDAAGNLYYLGQAREGKLVLRRAARGRITDLITDYAYADDFVVLPDGTVVLSGTTNATGAAWTRRVSPLGALRTLRASRATFLRRFPDGNVYFGVYGSGNGPSGVMRYLAGTDEVDERPWIASRWSGSGVDPHHDANALCEASGPSGGFCSGSGVDIRQSFTTADGKVFVVAGHGATGQLVQYFPTLARTRTAVAKVAVSEELDTRVVLSGLNAQDRNVTAVYDPATGEEQQLIGPADEVEIYHLDRVAGSDRVMFDGLRFSDNSYVLGQIDLRTGAVTTTATISGRLTGLTAFG